MGETSENKPNIHKKHICTGIVAHVDAGKTTLSEGMLYLSGSIRKLGRVDKGNTFLDTDERERSRGITIFSKQAVLETAGGRITLLDTPGHVDFSGEMERTLQVLDYAVLVISGADGVQGHTLTLWRLLERYGIPVFLFVNKMDQPGTDRAALLAELKNRLDGGCIDFSADQESQEFLENLAVCDERLMEQYLEQGSIAEEEIRGLIASRRVFPCYFGSALRLEGVEEFLADLGRLTVEKPYPEEFSARVYKISRDDQGNRLTHMKITGGTLKVKSLLSGKNPGAADGRWEEKINQIRLYSGDKYELVNEAEAGTVCAVTGLTATWPGEGLGAETENILPVLEPVLTYQIILPPESDVHIVLQKLRQLEEEEPLLHLVWNEQLGEIHAQVMGEIQIQILKSQIQERFGIPVEFGAGNIVYKETIREKAEGVGHFEPLRHYAEVHLLLEPGEPGSGLVFDTVCSEDELDKNWQRLILTHLMEREHPGVLTGSPITDMRITLAAGRAHLKHTEGGDFRQATYRAVRQGLKTAGCRLLEPYYDFRLEVPSDTVGRAMADIQKMSGTAGAPELEGEMAVLTGSAPVQTMEGYQTEVAAYTRGRGRLFCSLKGYEPCHNEEEIVEQIGYDSERDLQNPTGSVFCAHGAGFNVSWDRVKDYMHLESVWKKTEPQKEPAPAGERQQGSRSAWADEKELEEIFTRTYGPIKRERNTYSAPVIREAASGTERYRPAKAENRDEYLLVDGYNIIFAWDELRDLARTNIDGARQRLIDILCNYQGYVSCRLILVFDAYKVEGHTEEILKHHNIHVVYTREAETADQYIEKVAHEIGRRHAVTVATSDGLEQVIILGQGCRRMSAQGLKEEVERVSAEIRGELQKEGKTSGGRNYLFNYLDDETAEIMEDVRLGKRELSAAKEKEEEPGGIMRNEK